VPLGVCWRAFGKVWRLSGLPIEWWRLVCSKMHGMAKMLLKQRCHLWIFPAQDVWSYLIPVRSLCTIYDLMHRYEARFPEVSARGQYILREKHFKNICQWSKGILVDSELGKRQVAESYEVSWRKLHILPYIAPKYIYNTQATIGFDQRYTLPPKFIFYPAQFWEHKNHKRLVQAVALLTERIPDLSLVFVGSVSNGYESTRELVNRLGLIERIRFLGYVPDSDSRFPVQFQIYS